MAVAEQHSTAQVELVPISEIRLGERRRQDVGSIRGLASSIERSGLLQPIVIQDDGMLVFGERRLLAFRELGLAKIPARRFRGLSAKELRQMELEENQLRKPLSDYEASAERLREIEAAEREAEAEKTRVEPTQVSRGKRGPAPTSGSGRDLARRTGIPEKTIRETRAHVEAAERYPVLRGDHWSRAQAIRASDTLDKLSRSIRQVVLEQIARPGVTHADKIRILETVPELDADQQREIRKLHLSESEADRNLALTRAAAKPAPPDPTWVGLKEVQRNLRRIRKKSHAANFHDFDLLEEIIERMLGRIKELRDGRPRET